MVIDEDEYNGESEVEKEDQSRMISLEKSLEEFIKEFDNNVPDPVVKEHNH